MCRLFGVLSLDSLQPNHLLVNAPQSLWMQSHIDRKHLQGDGWGIGWFDGNKPRIFKSPKPLFNDKAHLSRAARQARGRALIGHVRWASNPLKLPKRELIGLAHTQPFGYARWIFAHNGTLYIPSEVSDALPSRWRRQIQGRNDSEVLFYWLMEELEPALKNPGILHSPGKLAAAVRKAMHGLDCIWLRCRKSHPIYRYGYHGVNWVLTNGELLLAFCYVDPRGFDKAKALCSRRQPYYQLQFRADSRQVCVASEPIDPKENWKSFRHGELLVAQRHNGAITVARKKVL